MSKETPAEEVGAALYSTHIQEFWNSYEEDPERAFRRFGFAFVHSLPPVQRLAVYKAHKWIPMDAIDHYNLGTAAVVQEEFDEAKKLYNKAIKQDEAMYQAHYNLSVLAHKQGDAKKAKVHAEKALAAAPPEEQLAIREGLAEALA